jgi:hypothetical protein
MLPMMPMMPMMNQMPQPSMENLTPEQQQLYTMNLISMQQQ